jgi:uncharacterized OB-fold protein
MDMSEVLPHHPESKPFFTALGAGKFLIKHCRACARPHWYPRALCPHCFSPDTEWREASGKGEIYSYSVSRTVAEPYAVAYVTLAEGPTMMTRLTETDFSKIAIGAGVKLDIRPADDGTPLPFFKLT